VIYQETFEVIDADTVSIVQPNVSGAPLHDGGKWRIVCPDPAFPDDPSKNIKTNALRINEGDGTIQFYIDRYIPHLTFNNRVYRVQRTNYYDGNRNGIKVVITMEGYPGEVP
jgi:hypothetical protein